MRKGFSGLSELLSALILLSVSIAVAFLLVYALPVVSPPSVKPWLKPTLIAAFKTDSTGRIYLYNPHSDYVALIDAWGGGGRVNFTCSGDCRIDPRGYKAVELNLPSGEDSVLLRFDTGAWLEVRFS